MFPLRIVASTGKPSDRPAQEDLNQFLAGLPELWRLGEVRPTHRKAAPKARYWRTRKDPFANVWADILLWLQEAPDSTGKLLLGRLMDKYPGQFTPKGLRTLQRRIGEWRGTTARRLVLGTAEESQNVQPVAAVVSPIGKAALRLATLASAQPSL